MVILDTFNPSAQMSCADGTAQFLTLASENTEKMLHLIFIASVCPERYQAETGISREKPVYSPLLGLLSAPSRQRCTFASHIPSGFPPADQLCVYKLDD